MTPFVLLILPPIEPTFSTSQSVSLEEVVLNWHVQLCFRHAISALFLLISIVFSSGYPARAQVLYGSIVGSVTDPSGASVPAATVRVTQTQTNEIREVSTNDAGGYILST